MIDRLFKNYKTTLLGIFVMLVSFILVWHEKATLTEVSLFFTGGFAMLFMKDPNVNKK